MEISIRPVPHRRRPIPPDPCAGCPPTVSIRPYGLVDPGRATTVQFWATSSGNRRRNKPPSLGLAPATGQRRIGPLIGPGCSGLPSGDPLPERRRRESRPPAAPLRPRELPPCDRVRIRWIYRTDRSILLAAGHPPIETHRTPKARSRAAPQRASSSAEVGLPALRSCSSGS